MRRWLILLFSLIFLGITAPASAQTASPEGRLSNSQEALLRQNIKTALSRKRGPLTQDNAIIRILHATEAWAFGTTAIPAPPGVHTAPEAFLFIARTSEKQTDWEVALEGDPAFSTWIAASPEKVVSANEKQILGPSRIGYAGNDQVQLSLPWEVGNIWYFNGPHEASRSSQDFWGGSTKVTAARDGIAYRPCENLIRISHTEGWSTGYYHVVNYQVTDGQPVSRGQYLADIENGVACGGSSTGPHVHFSLLKNGSEVSIVGHDLGGWTVQQTPGQAEYQGCMQHVRDGEVRCQYELLPNTGLISTGSDTIGIYKNGVFSLRNSNSTGPADITVTYGGAASHLPITGDWNGDKIDTIGIYDTNTGVFQLRDSNTAGAPDYVFTLGNPGDTPLAGKWDNTMTHDGAGVYRNTNGILYLRKTLTTGFSDYYMVLGNPGDAGIAGDWDGNGYDSVGVYRSSGTHFYLSNVNGNGITFSDVDFGYSIAGGLPFAGDWTGTGQSRVAFFKDGNAYYRNSLTTGTTDTQFSYGSTGAFPVAGKWVLRNPGVVPTSFKDGFDIVYTGYAEGWYWYYYHSPGSVNGWYQGDTTKFSAQAGAANSYVAASKNTVSGNSTINLYLVSPPITTLSNGDTVSFWTRTVTGSTRPDRLYLKVIPDGTCPPNNWNNAASAITLISVNPGQSVGGYPTTWTQYSATLTGISGTVSGCFAFQYYVTNGGPSGPNSEYIGIDSFVYTDTNSFAPPPAVLVYPGSDLSPSDGTNAD